MQIQQRLSIKRVIQLFAVGVIAFFVVQVVSKIIIPQQDKVTKAQEIAFQEALNDNFFLIQNGHELPKRSYSTQQYGLLGSLLELITNNALCQQDATKAFTEKTQHINISSCLKPEYLIDANSIDNSIQQITFLQTEYQALIKTLFENREMLLEEIQASKLPAEIKDRFLITGSLESLMQPLDLTEQVAQIHFEYTSAILDLLLFAKSRLDFYNIKDGRIVFENTEDMERFNQFFEIIVQIETKMIEKAEEGMKKVNEM